MAFLGSCLRRRGNIPIRFRPRHGLHDSTGRGRRRRAPRCRFCEAATDRGRAHRQQERQPHRRIERRRRGITGRRGDGCPRHNRTGPRSLRMVRRSLRSQRRAAGQALGHRGRTMPGFPIPRRSSLPKASSTGRISFWTRRLGLYFSKRKGMALDLGSTSKGYAADEVAKLIRKAGVKSAIIDLGGNILAGRAADGKPWRIGLRGPSRLRRATPRGIREPDEQDDGHLGRVRALLYQGRQAIPPAPRYEHGLSGNNGPTSAANATATP